MADISKQTVQYADEFRWPNKEIRVLSAFCYIPFCGIFMPLFLDKIIKNQNSQQRNLSENIFVRFHLTQSYVLFWIHFIALLVPFINFSLTLLCYLIFNGIHALKSYKGEAFRLWWIRAIFPVDVAVMNASIYPLSSGVQNSTENIQSNSTH